MGHVMRNKTFWPDSLYNLPIKNGVFIKYDRIGKEKKRLKYHFDKIMNHRIFGLKNGSWSEEPLMSNKYFMGIRVRSIHSMYSF